MQIAGMYAQSYDNLFGPSYFLFDFKNEITISASSFPKSLVATLNEYFTGSRPDTRNKFSP